MIHFAESSMLKTAIVIVAITIASGAASGSERNPLDGPDAQGGSQTRNAPLEKFQALSPAEQRNALPQLLADERFVGDTRERMNLLALFAEIQPDGRKRADPLIPLLKTKSAPLIADALANIGPPAIAAKDELQSLLKSNDIAIAGSAARALLRISPRDVAVTNVVHTTFWRLLATVEPADTPFDPYGEFRFVATIVAQHPAMFETEMLKQLKAGDESVQMKVLLTWSYISGVVPRLAMQTAIRHVESPKSSDETKYAALLFLTSTSARWEAFEIDATAMLADEPLSDLSGFLRFQSVNFKVELKALRPLLDYETYRPFALYLLEREFPGDIVNRELLALLKRLDDRKPMPWQEGDPPYRPIDIKTHIASALGNKGTGAEAVAALAGMYRQALPKEGYTKPTFVMFGTSDDTLRRTCVDALTKLGTRGEDVTKVLTTAVDDPSDDIRETAERGLARCLARGNKYADGIETKFGEARRQLTVANVGLSVSLEGYSLTALLEDWWNTSTGDSKARCQRQILRMINNQRANDRLALLQYFAFDPSCQAMLAPLRTLVDDESLTNNERRAVAVAVCKIAPNDARAREFLLAQARASVKIADQFPVRAHAWHGGCLLPPDELDVGAIYLLSNLARAQGDELLREAVKSRNIEMRRAATIAIGSHK